MGNTLAPLALLCAIVGLIGTADAGTNLNGVYIFAGDRSCTISSTPFGTDASGAPTLISGPVIRQGAVDTGTFTFHTDGTGVQAGRSTTIDLSTTTVGASIYSLSEFSVPFTYVVNPDGSLDIKFTEGTFSVLLGADAGAAGTTGPRSEHDALGEGNSVFIAGLPTDIEQQTIVTNPPGGSSFTRYRLCVRSGVRPRQP